MLKKQAESVSRVVLVTGASGGIGSACVRQFLNQGWRVSATALPGPDLERHSGPDVLVIPGDLTSAPTRQRIIDETLARYGRVDALINNAGIGLYETPVETQLDLMERLFDLNVTAALAMAQAVVPVMRRQKSGSIVNLGSVAAFSALPWAAAYCASKAALHSFNDALRREVSRDGIHVMKVCPGIVDTNFRANVLAGAAPVKVSGIQRVVTPDAVAAGIVRGINSRRHTVYVPQIGRLFRLVEYLTPGIMDWYTGGLATPPKTSGVYEDTGVARAR
jgi:short-subunit dehydrogenase